MVGLQELQLLNIGYTNSGIFSVDMRDKIKYAVFVLQCPSLN